MTREYPMVRRTTVIMMAVLVSLGLVTSASAHENREVGDFHFNVGFMNEPAYVGEMNGVLLNITRGGPDGEPVEIAPGALQATITHGDESKDVELRSVFNEPGTYTANVIPTSTGTYSFRFTGQIEGQEIDETFRSGPDTFADVEPRDALEFPGGGSAETDDSDQAMAIGLAGIVAGLLGLVAGAAGYVKASSAASPKSEGQRGRRSAASERSNE